jgi:hypothetical protein
MEWGGHHRNRKPGVNPGGSEVNGFPEKVLLATDGSENMRLAVRGRPSISRRRTMRRVLAKGETMKLLHPRPSLPTSIVFLLIAV